MKNKDKSMAMMFPVLAVCASLFAASAFGAPDVARADYAAIKDHADADYKAAHSNCAAFKDNAKDVCISEAKLNKVRAVAIAKAHYKNTLGAHKDARIDIADAEYALAKERCDDASGNDKDVCVKLAKANKDAAIADAKAGKKIAEAQTDAINTKNKAFYILEIEKCAGVAGTSRDSCVAAVNSQFGK